jgi:DNA helicase-2/ATP-dependent DNA helicase PcrA
MLTNTEHAEALNYHQQQFNSIYASLNAQQRIAVDTLQGPVLVVAGPGTGKTQIIAARICNLLRSSDDQVQPQHILCLTYTDNGAVSMRKRLLQMIGPAAHQVKICTFHSFCNDVIQSNLDYFEKHQLELISDLERVDMMEHIIDNLPVTHPLKRLKGDLYYDVPLLNNLFNTMKSENWMPDYIYQCIDEYLQSLPDRDGFRYKRAYRNFKAGDIKQNLIDQEVEKMDKLKAAVGIYPLYAKAMQDKHRYDYQDMILWVIRAFKDEPRLLLPYKELYRYILVDEFQDTNGAQNEILNLLTEDADRSPNVFCVGDDDQSIYEFQGARVKNIADFAHKYAGTISIVVLDANYRSTQAILDISKRVIDQNQDRLIHVLIGLTKDIKAARAERISSTVTPVLREYMNTAQEEADLCNRIENLIQQGVKPSDIAVLYYKHAQAENLITYFNRKAIPYQVRKKINILHQPLTQQILNILTYISKEFNKPYSGEEQLFRMLHYYFFHIHHHDVASLGLYIKSKKDLSWRETISDRAHLKQIKLRSSDAIEQLGACINRWITDSANLTLQMLFEKIIYESGLVAYLAAHTDRFHLMEELNTFYDFIKVQNNKKPKLNIDDLVSMLEQMEQHKITLDINKTVYREEGVVFSTCHSAKGSEYRHVFVIGCVKDKWEGSSGNNKNYSLPDTLTFSTTENQLESSRRLFYVALTRAEEFLYISYYRFTNEQKEVERSLFVEETGLNAELIQVSNENLLQYQLTLASAGSATIQLPNRDYLKSRIENLVFSHSLMNEYLKCPLSFYFNKILLMPSAKNDTLTFGNAIHKSMELLFKKMLEQGGRFPEVEYVVEKFEWFMHKERESFTDIQFKNKMHLGREVLTAYYNTHISQWHKQVDLEYRISGVQIEGVPCIGFADKIEWHDQGAVVIDYKSGQVENSVKELNPPKADDNGGSYWRQMYFYKLLLDADSARRRVNMTRGEFHFVEKNKQGRYEVKRIDIMPEYLSWMRHKIKEVYAKIQNLEFNQGCNEDDCRWCNFVKQNQISFEMS